MAHPYSEHRQHKVERERAHHMTRGYASGGAVHSDAKADAALIRHTVKKSALKADGGAVNPRMDRRARGGRTKAKKGTNVNVIVAPHSTPPMLNTPPGGVPAPIPRPPAVSPPMAPPAGMAGMPPGLPPGGPPGMPPGIRRQGGRAYASGGTVVFREGRKNGTQVQHSDGKNDGKNIGRGKPVTYATGGAIEAPGPGKAMGPKLEGGSGGGVGRMEKARRARGKG